MFTVTADKDYAITGIKINDKVVPAVQGRYSFTPTEEKTYTLTVETIPFAAYKTKITFTGLESDEKNYVAKETTKEGYEEKIEYKSDMEFITPIKDVTALNVTIT